MNNKLTDERPDDESLEFLITIRREIAERHASEGRMGQCAVHTLILNALLELQKLRKADSEPAGYHVIKECGKVGCSVATLEEAEKTRDFWNKKWIIKPYFYAPPVQETGVYKDMLNIINLLENNEWAEHCTGTVLGSLLESEITRLVSKEQSAPVVPDDWVMVPKEPTRQMMAQGHFAMKGTDRGKFRRIYQAMITAAPALNKGGINAE
ncbi:phage protein [Salmonella enterica subsp. arizonae]|uniref:Phage protein n=1 Tax=Salmonella enterica subsp. arizonae TaxID=59203 RepID=A0A379S2Y8_SALER|nr:phage protein [Salmonella enterica subsp. arizonae]